MFKDTPAFSGFSVRDLAEAKKFYAETLGVTVEEQEGMGFTLNLVSGNNVFIYPKPDHVPATYTILNFVVVDIDAAVDELLAKGITIERYEGAHQDEKGIARGIAAQKGLDIAWFKDPSGNILSVLKEA
jgi:catechol 2,3-dioxygenase-like lactoylglutathione lyase family enzyme